MDRCFIVVSLAALQMDDKELEEDDHVFERDGARVVIDDVRVALVVMCCF